jgi:ubiquitin conjugation factor E4 B
LNKIHELKEIEAEMANTIAWNSRPAQEREERLRVFHQSESIVRFDMKLANEGVGMLAFTSEQIPAPLLLPEMVERVASMLNYFLLQLAGPQRKSLTVKDPEKYEFKPKQLLKQVSWRGLPYLSSVPFLTFRFLTFRFHLCYCPFKL